MSVPGWWQERGWLVAVAVATAAGAVLRFATLGGQSYDGDELYSAWLAALPLQDLLDTVPESESTPYLHYLLTWGWLRVLGTPEHSEAALRAVPALAGVATIPAGAALARRLFGSPRVAVATAGLLAVNPLLVFFSQQARAYALLVLLCTLAAIAWVAVLDRPATPGRALVAWAGLSVLALATHYFAAFLVVGQALWLLVVGRRCGALRAMSAGVAVPVVAGLALIPLAWTQLDNPGGIAGVPLLTRAAQVPKSFLVGFTLPAELPLMLLCAALAFVALAGLGRRGPRALVASRGVRITAGLAAAIIVVPAAAALAGADGLTARNLLPGVVPMVLLLAAGGVATRAGVAALVGLGAVSVVIVLTVAARPELQRADWRGAAAAVGAGAAPRVLVMSPGTAPGPFGVYTGGAAPLGPAGADIVEVDVLALATRGAFALGHPRPPALPAAPRAPAGFRLVERRRTPTFTLLRFRADRPRPITPADAARLSLDPVTGQAAWALPVR